MRGIVSYGVYLPYWRLDRKSIGEALGAAAGLFCFLPNFLRLVPGFLGLAALLLGLAALHFEIHLHGGGLTLGRLDDRLDARGKRRRDRLEAVLGGRLLDVHSSNVAVVKRVCEACNSAVC
jgi:hypothetical protein